MTFTKETKRWHADCKYNVGQQIIPDPSMVNKVYYKIWPRPTFWQIVRDLWERLTLSPYECRIRRQRRIFAEAAGVKPSKLNFIYDKEPKGKRKTIIDKMF